MEEIKIGMRYDFSCHGRYYMEVVEIMDIKKNRALILAMTPHKEEYYTFFIRDTNTKKWRKFITSYDFNRVSYLYDNVSE